MTEQMISKLPSKQRLFTVFRGPIIAAAIVISGVLTWTINNIAFPLSRDPKTAKAQLRRLVPNGTPLAVATNRMKEMGFSCATVTNESFEDEASTDVSTRRYNGNYVRCVDQQNGLFGFPTYMWVIGLVRDENDRVTNLLVRISNRSLVIP